MAAKKQPTKSASKPAARTPTVASLTTAHKKAALAYQTARLEHATRRISQTWDATTTNKNRRQPRRETKNEGGIYTPKERVKGCNIGRDLERNYSPAKAMMHQFRVNVVGSLGKIKVNSDNDNEGTDWFNEVWSKDCDFRDDVHWSLMLQNLLVSPIREGDALMVFDDGIIEDSGKLLTWESDQILPVADELMPELGFEGMKQDNGIVRDKIGKIIAYLTTGKRGATVISKKDDVTPFVRGVARLVKNPWRLNQGRGTPALLTPSANFTDLYEILGSELLTAKRASQQYGYAKRKDAVTDWDDPSSGPEWLPENDGRTEAEVDADGANQTTHNAKNYENLVAFTGGMMDYIDPEDEVMFPAMHHPNRELAPFLEAVHGYGGSALGLARAYAILRADSSYTSFRGDMIMSWVTFYWMQKQLERQVADWVGIKALGWAQRKNEIKTLPAGWERSISWTWPTMPEVDELDAENATAAALKNGTTDYAELLGPDWRKRMESFAEQINHATALGLPLSVLEMKSGGIANPKKDNNGGAVA